MKVISRGTLMMLVSLLAVAPLSPGGFAHADPGGPSVDATCVFKGHGIFASPVDPGGTNNLQADTIRTTGTVECTDLTGAATATGTFETTFTLPEEECTGDLHGATAAGTVTWAEGTVSTFLSDHDDMVKSNGTTSHVITGTVTQDSARYAGDTTHAVGISYGAGCGTQDGETVNDTTLVMRLSH